MEENEQAGRRAGVYHVGHVQGLVPGLCLYVILERAVPDSRDGLKLAAAHPARHERDG